jgi:peptide/nickel transport system permease protein
MTKRIQSETDPKGQDSLRLKNEMKKNGNNNTTISGIVLINLAVILFLTLFGNYIAPHDPLAIHLNYSLHGPSLHYPLGNDFLGRCLLSRILAGARTSVGLGIIATVVSSLIGIVIGLVSGYAGGFIDEIVMRITDVFLSFPHIIIVVTIAGIMAPGAVNLVFAIVIVGWMRYARIVRSITISTRESLYVKSAEISGISNSRIILTHILPSCKQHIIVMASLGLSKSILAISSLGFLGFGIQPPQAEWGRLLLDGKDYILTSPHLSVFPGLFIIFTVMTLNLSGDLLSNNKGK